MLRTSLLVTAGLVACGSALAESQQLSGDALKEMVVGKTVVLNTPMGGIPISYSGNGTMTGRAKDMRLYTGRERDQGIWWVNADQICQKWDTWLDGRSYCFKLRLEGRVVHWRRNDGHSGTATIASN